MAINVCLFISIINSVTFLFISLCFRETKIMVQLSPSRTIETLTPSELTVEKEDDQGSPKSESPRMLTALQFTLSPTTTTYYGYEKYIEDGLICLKHKIRNIEKKKLKLESYSERLKKGVNVRSPGGGFISQTHTTHRDPASALYVSRESFKQGGGTATQRSSAGWSDSSQVSSPDREGVYPLDSGISDTLSIPPMEVPQGSHTLMPVQVYQLRVAFSAARTANFAPGTLDQPIAFDLLHTNLGDMFDTTTGRFTCPAAGAYVFIFHILKLAISVPLYINLMRNEEVMVSAYANDGAPDHETATNHCILQLFQGDQVWLRLHRGAIYGSSWKYSTFSGFLLYQD
uniref:Caprin family member 2 n=1 Tax=Cyprinus carpio carpio TaxID=630221 RepID=A0A9J8B7I6_CYPCA